VNHGTATAALIVMKDPSGQGMAQCVYGRKQLD
jgi:hypothetical protein